MNAGRTVLLIILTLLLAVALVGGQLMFLAQQTVLKTSFLLPHVERLNSTISTPQTHEGIVRYLVGEVLNASRLRNVNAMLREYLMRASVKALSPQWMQEEVLGITNEMLAVLRGKSQEFKHTIYLSRRKEVLMSELARVLPPGADAELRSASSAVPDSVELTSLMGKEVPDALRFIGQRYMLFSLLLIYVIPGVLVLLALQVGRVRWGIVGIGMAALLSGLAAGAGYMLAWPKGVEITVHAVGRRLPEAFAWFTAFLRVVLEDVRSAGRTFSVALAAAGAVLLLIGIVVVALTRKKPA